MILMLFSVIVSPASAQEVEDPKQPSVDNPHMHFWELVIFQAVGLILIQMILQVLHKKHMAKK